jgi:hypothetical protein
LPGHGVHALVLPVNGTWCRPVRGGFKVFDMKRKRVIKVYDSGTDKEIVRREIELFSKIGQHEFAPSLKNWSVDEGWYEEEFIEGLSGNGLVPRGIRELMTGRYFSLIEPLLKELILVGSPQSVSASSYLEALEDPLDTEGEREEDEVVLEANAFIHRTVSRCRKIIGGKSPEITPSGWTARESEDGSRCSENSRRTQRPPDRPELLLISIQSCFMVITVWGS